MDPEGEATAVILSSSSENDKKVSATPQKKKPWNRRRNKSASIEGPTDSMAEHHLMSTDMSSNKPDDEDASDIASEADLESQAMYSYNPSRGDVSVYTASNSIMMSGGALNSNHSMYGNDNMSYAYSLEPGIEASVADGLLNNTSMSHSMCQDDSERSRIPIREIPQITLASEDGIGASAGNSGKGILQPSSSVTGQNNKSVTATSIKDSNDDGFGGTQIETSASDLKLTSSELAMLPSNLKSDDDEEKSNQADENGFPTKKLITRKIKAPSGKLGIVIDTTVEGPVVHNVNEGSRLQGEIFPGDVIIAIDDVDTRAMSASAITALMVKTANQKRTLTVRGVAPSK